jgi:hypothetical protein
VEVSGYECHIPGVFNITLLYFYYDSNVHTGRIDLCEVAITKKVDKSFLGHIESLVVDLEKYSEHRVTAEKKLAKLEAQTATLLNG